MVRAQHAFSEGAASYDAKVPTPRSVLGYDIGERFTPHRLMLRYIERVAAASKRVRVDTVARTFEGREMLVLTVTSERNMSRLKEIQADAQHVGDPRGASPGDLEAATRRLPAVVWIAHSVHGGEASGAEAGLALLYQLAAGTDAETQAALDSVVVLIDPNENPDGRERHTHDLERTMSAQGVSSEPGAMNNSGSWPGPRTSHYYFDLNRDWFIQSHPESQGRVRTFMSWWPHVALDLHEQGSSSTFYFAPPREPDNKNNPLHLTKWFDIFAAAHGAAFDAHGWSYFRREGYDSFYPGYGEGWPMLTGSIGMLFEAASSAGGAVRRNDGLLRTLRQAAWEHYTAEWTTVRTSGRRRAELVRDYAASRQEASTGRLAAPQRAAVIERDAQGRADSLASLLARNGIDVLQAPVSLDLRDATAYGEPPSPATSSSRAAPSAPVRVAAGAYVVDYAQPQGHLAKALLEPDAELDSTFVRFELEMRRTGLPNRFYDITAWSLPFAYRLRAWSVRSLPSALTPVRIAGVPPVTAARATYAYAFEPGSEASIRLLAALLKDSVRVWHAPRGFASGAAQFPHGAFLVRVASNTPDVHDRVMKLAAAASARVVPIPSAGVDSGTDLGSNSVVPVRPPSVALLGGAPVNGGSFGFAWYALDQRIGFPVTLIDAGFVSNGALDRFNVVVVPSAPGAQLDRALGESGAKRLADWVRAGGVLVTIDGASAWVAGERVGLTRFRVRRDSVRADSAGGAPLPARVPGSIARASGDTLSPLLAGVSAAEIPVFVNSDVVFSVPKDLRAGEAVVRFAAESRLRLSGYFWPEVSARLALSPYLWTERVGGGRVIAFAHDPNFRDLFRGLLPLFANAVLLGPSM